MGDVGVVAILPRYKHAAFRSSVDGKIHVGKLNGKEVIGNSSWVKRETHRMLELVYHFHETTRAHAHVVPVCA